MAEPLVPGPSRLEFEIAIATLKKYKSSGSDQILAELIQAEGETLLSLIQKLINSVWIKEELPDQWKESIIVPVHRKGDKTDCNNYCGISLLSTSYKILSNILLSRLRLYINEINLSIILTEMSAGYPGGLEVNTADHYSQDLRFKTNPLR
jgi:hypothetical protein